jgi:phosphatidylserine/phosphatidylglycerophosphate/cardiolipin synthase-like enzyme
MANAAARFVTSVLATAAAAVVGWSAVATPARAAVEPDPVMNAAVFNEPLGASAAQRNAIFMQLARLIDRVPAGEEIQLSVFHFTTGDTVDAPDAPDIVDRLLNAHARGARVKVILDQSSAPHGPYQRLRTVLGTDDTAGSYVVHCADRFPSQKRGCIGTRTINYASGPVVAYNHNKFLTASKIVMNSGAVVSNVVYQASSNLTGWDQSEAYNNAVTWSDPGTYADYRRYFGDLRAYRHDSNGNNNYYWVGASGTPYKAHFFPRQERAGQPVSDPATDTIVNVLNSVTSCSYDDNGVRRQTDVRVAMFSFNRAPIAQKLTALRNAGCWVDVVFSEANSAVLSALGRNVQLTRCTFNAGPGRDIRLHSKYMLVDGAYDDDIVPRVFTGSHNYAVSALRQADEAMVRIMGRGMHDAYLRNFWHVRDTCRARGGAIH